MANSDTIFCEFVITCITFIRQNHIQEGRVNFSQTHSYSDATSFGSQYHTPLPTYGRTSGICFLPYPLLKIKNNSVSNILSKKVKLQHCFLPGITTTVLGLHVFWIFSTLKRYGQEACSGHDLVYFSPTIHLKTERDTMSEELCSASNSRQGTKSSSQVILGAK